MILRRGVVVKPQLRRPCLRGVLALGLLLVSFAVHALGETWQVVTPLTRVSSIDDLHWDGVRFVAVGSGGALLYSLDGQRWTHRPSGTDSHLHALATAGNGQWLAVGDAGTLVGSTDRRMGVPETSPSSVDLLAIASDGETFIAVGDSATLMRRDKAGIWTLQPLPTALAGQTLRAVAWHAGLWLAAGDQGTLIASQDGQSWAVVPLPTRTDNYALFWFQSAGLWLMAGSGGTLLSSHDGAIWTVTYTDAAAGVLRDLGGQGSAVFAVGDQARVIKGSMGSASISWQSLTTPVVLASRRLMAVAANDGRLLMMGESGVTLWSDDAALSWQVALPLRQRINDVLWNGSRWYAVAKAGQLLQSADGLSWMSSSLATTLSLNGIAWNGTRFVVAADKKTLFWSDDALTWHRVPVVCPIIKGSLPTTPMKSPTCDIQDVAWAPDPGQFVAVGAFGTILLSKDGVSWTARAADPRQLTVNSAVAPVTFDFRRPTLTAVAWKNLFVAVGYQGNIWTSLDGETWTVRGTGLTSAPLETVLWDNNHSQWLVAGDGVLLSSLNGIDWVLVHSPELSSGNGLAWLQDMTLLSDRVLAVGRSGVIMTSPSGIDWRLIKSGQGNTTFFGVDSNFVDIDTPADTVVAVGEQGLIMTSTTYPDLLISGGVTETVVARDRPLNYRFSLVNKKGGQTAHDVQWSFTLPADMALLQPAAVSQGACTTNGKAMTCRMGDMAPGDTASLDMVLVADKAGTQAFTLTVVAQEPDANDLDNVLVSKAVVTAVLPATVTEGPRLGGAASVSLLMLTILTLGVALAGVKATERG